MAVGSWGAVAIGVALGVAVDSVGSVGTGVHVAVFVGRGVLVGSGVLDGVMIGVLVDGAAVVGVSVVAGVAVAPASDRSQKSRSMRHVPSSRRLISMPPVMRQPSGAGVLVAP